jgi:DNA-dependent RNA polymerase auxiliary subunit epsilon
MKPIDQKAYQLLVQGYSLNQAAQQLMAEDGLTKSRARHILRQVYAKEFIPKVYQQLSQQKELRREQLANLYLEIKQSDRPDYRTMLQILKQLITLDGLDNEIVNKPQEFKVIITNHADSN